MIKVKFYGAYKQFMPQTEEDGFWHCEDDNITVAELLDKTGASQKVMPVTILVNRVRKDKEYVLVDGDTITVMPLVAGG